VTDLLYLDLYREFITREQNYTKDFLLAPHILYYSTSRGAPTTSEEHNIYIYSYIYTLVIILLLDY